MKRSSDNGIRFCDWSLRLRPAKIGRRKVCSDPSVPVGTPYLQEIPVEIFLQICSYLDVSCLGNSLSKVCRRFKEILSDKELWQKWIRKRLRNPYPASHLDTVEFDWLDAGVKLDKEIRRWTSNHKLTNKYFISYEGVLLGVKEKILLMNNADLCLCGGMGRELTLWKVPQTNWKNNKPILPMAIHRNAHKGSVSGLATDDSCDYSLAYSASEDGTIKSWDLSTALTCLETYECDSAVFSVENSGNLILAGLRSKVQLFDCRSGRKPINSYKVHRDAVSILEAHDNYVVSASYDKTLAVWDKRMHNLLQSDKRLPHCDQACPTSLKWENSSMYVGDNMGSLHLFDVSSFDVVASYRLWGEMKPAAHLKNKCLITYNSGVIVCCSDRGKIKFFYSSDPPEEFKTLQSSLQHITGVQYENDVLAICTQTRRPADSFIEFWIPE